MRSGVKEEPEPLTVGGALSVVTLREFRNRLSELAAGVRNEHALLCIGPAGTKGSAVLAPLLTALAETHVATRASEGALAARGDEVLCLLPACGRESALIFARLLRAASQMAAEPGLGPQLGIGVVPFTDKGLSPERLLKLAHSACMAARRRGNNHIEVCESV